MSDVRISIGVLAPVISVDGSETRLIGILNRRALSLGQRRYAAIGGAVELTTEGIIYLQRRFDARAFEGSDARFIVDEQHVDDVLEFFERRSRHYYEVDPDRELGEELTQRELPIQSGPLLTDAQFDEVYPVFVRVHREAPEADASARQGSIPTRRLYFLYRLDTTAEIMAVLEQSPAVRFFTDEEVQSGATADGSATVAGNIIR